jgi:hypothetical protein
MASLREILILSVEEFHRAGDRHLQLHLWLLHLSSLLLCAASFVRAMVDLAGTRDVLLWDFTRTWDVILEESHNQLGTLASGPGGIPKRSFGRGSFV